MPTINMSKLWNDINKEAFVPRFNFYEKKIVQELDKAHKQMQMKNALGYTSGILHFISSNPDQLDVQYCKIKDSVIKESIDSGITMYKQAIKDASAVQNYLAYLYNKATCIEQIVYAIPEYYRKHIETPYTTKEDASLVRKTPFNILNEALLFNLLQQD